jgi:hypothetical protein
MWTGDWPIKYFRLTAKDIDYDVCADDLDESDVELGDEEAVRAAITELRDGLPKALQFIVSAGFLKEIEKNEEAVLEDMIAHGTGCLIWDCEYTIESVGLEDVPHSICLKGWCLDTGDEHGDAEVEGEAKCNPQ